MALYKYAFGKFNKELMARASARDAPVSTKTAIEMCNFLRKRKLSQAKVLMQEVQDMKRAVPFKRFTDGVGHRAGKLASGRFPQKGSRIMLNLLESVEANAQLKGLNTNELSIIHICAHKAHTPVHYGRNSGRSYKRTHIEIVVQETPSKKEKTKTAKKAQAAPKKEENKVEAKPEVKSEAKPEVKKEEKKSEPKKEEKTQTPKKENQGAQ